MNDAWNIPGYTAQNGAWGTLDSNAPIATFPPGVATVTVTGHLLDSDGRPANGRYTFDPSADRLVDTATAVIIRMKTKIVNVKDGLLSVTLIASDNTGFSPQNFTYRVKGVIAGQTQDAIDILLPKAIPEVELGNLVPVATSMGTVYTPTVWTVNDEPGPNVVLTAADVDADPAGSAAAAQTAAVADAASKYVPLAGGTLTGGLTLDGANFTVQREDGEGAYRLRVTGDGLDFEVGGMDVHVSAWSEGDFTGAQTNVMRWEPAGPHLIGRTQFGTNPFNAVHDLDAGTGVASLGAKNGLANVRLAGFKDSAGAPPTGTWAAGDVVLDSAGAWHLCTAAGTPGTWT
ncbi:hypothetical protein [Streptomyces sp. NPDC002088]|uniref:hypothetical protein n=1 Tax=Streptomyces sp. NPDC002088 TaxID=3154665 RepID=UPI00332B18D8